LWLKHPDCELFAQTGISCRLIEASLFEYTPQLLLESRDKAIYRVSALECG
jgi:hypothetical protein